MKIPASRKTTRSNSDFQALHDEKEQKEFTGSLSIETEDFEGVVVYSDGSSIYAYTSNNDYAKEALDEIMNASEGTVKIHESTDDKIEMFRDYMEYIGDEGLLDTHETENKRLDERIIRTKIPGHLRKGSSVGQDDLHDDADESRKWKETTIPGGIKRGYATDEQDAVDYFDEKDATGYALSGQKVVFFKQGKPIKEEKLVYEDTDSNPVEVSGSEERELDMEEWQVIESSKVEDMEEEDSGLLGGFLGG